jgi:cytochrome P450 family 144
MTTAKRIRAAEHFVADTAEQLLERGLRGGRIEWMSAVANRLPMMVVARLIGLPDDDVDMLIAGGYATTGCDHLAWPRFGGRSA